MKNRDQRYLKSIALGEDKALAQRAGKASLKIPYSTGATIKKLIAACMIGFVAFSEIMPGMAAKVGFGTQFGAALILSTAILAFSIYMLNNGFDVALSWTYFPTVILLFTLYCFITSPRALSPEKAFDTSKKLFISWFSIFMFYEAWSDYRDDVDALLFCQMISSYLIAGFVVVSIGFGGLTSLLTSQERISNENMNANTLGMNCSYAILINFYFLHKRKYRMFFPIIVLAFLLLAVSQSRKGLFVLVLGIIGYIILFNMQRNHIFRNIIKIMIIIVVFILLYLILSKLSIFSGMMKRIEDMVVGFTASTSKDGSFNTRMRMKEIGKEIFNQNPLLGIGVDNSGFICGREFGFSYFYLHDNYIELLADTGIIGFGIYYSGYAVMALRFLRYWRFQDAEFTICFVLLILSLIFDYGMVSFLSKSTYFYAFVIWMETEKISGSRYRTRQMIRTYRYIKA